MLTVSGSSAPPSRPVRIVAFVGADAGLAITIVWVRPAAIPPLANSQRFESSGAPSESARPFRPSVPSSDRDCSAITRPRRAVTSVDDEVVPARVVVHRDRDPTVARYDESLQIFGGQRSGVGQEVDVDDRVVGERVEQREEELRTFYGGPRGEVPPGCGVPGARAEPGVAIAGDRVRHDRVAPGDLDHHPGLGDRKDVRDAEVGERSALDVDVGDLGVQVRALHDADPCVGDAAVDVRDVDPLVGAAAGVGGAVSAVPRRLDRVGGRNARTERDELPGRRSSCRTPLRSIRAPTRRQPKNDDDHDEPQLAAA